ncbi:MAG: alpha/beta hydrolase family protein [Planctomycetes bacterium]|nr:alpha/beta hydrolase family protein [Planctomycetota bacterium]
MSAMYRLCVMILVGGIFAGGASATQQTSKPSPADRMLAEYFQSETKKLQDQCLSDIKTLDDWKAKRPAYKQQLLEMLGLDPLPAKTPLKATTTGTTEHEQFTVDKLHYQSMPGLYVTANLYIPKGLTKPAPAVLYICGHGNVKKGGISYGAKVSYQHHGEWFARNGYVCLTIDTLQLGEIEGIHHGTYRYNMWWWNCRGYTPAGVEAWNCVRALDYLETRKEVDANRIGVTGRSGGGAYSWWIAAIDERIKVAVPVAGITDLQNHVVDGTVEGHCDCMFIVNTYRWDYPLVAALVAPRPLLISNSDKDTIFPLDGVLRVHEKVRRIYKLYGAEKNLGLQITEGPHKDTQELRTHAFVWFNRFLKNEDPLIRVPAEPLLQPQQLRVFDKLPADEINTKIQETFVPMASQCSVPQSKDEWTTLRDGWMKALREKVFHGWPTEREAGPLDVDQIFTAEKDGIRLTAYDFNSQPHVRLRLFLISAANVRDPDSVMLGVLDEARWTQLLSAMRVKFENQLGDYRLPDPDLNAFEDLRKLLDAGQVGVYFCPRGIGAAAWTGDEKKQIQIRRRFMLLGQTLDGMRVWDVHRAIEALGQIHETAGIAPSIGADGTMGGVALYASLFEPQIASLALFRLPTTHRDGPIFLNVLRYLDMPQAVALAAERTSVTLPGQDASAWRFPTSVVESFGWDRQQLQIIAPPDRR